MAFVAAGVTVAWHHRFLTLDEALPLGDAGGHLVNCIRALHWLGGRPFIPDALPPAVYVTSAWVSSKFGVSQDHMALGVALYSGLMASALSWLGWRTTGWLAALLLPLLALSAPMLSGMSRLILLDLPATACIVTIWVLVWESRFFRVPLPTLLLGFMLGLAALVKYTYFLWVLPLLALTGAVMVLRAPSSLLPLLLLGPSLRTVALSLHTRALMPADTTAVSGQIQYLLLVLGQGALLQVGVLLLARFLPGPRILPGGQPARWRQGLTDGALLGLAALLAVAVITPWFTLAMPQVWGKVQHEAIEEVRTSGLDTSIRFAQTLLAGSWPGGWWALIAAFYLEAAGLLEALGRALLPGLRRWGPLARRWPLRDRTDTSNHPSTDTGPAERLGPGLPIALSCAVGVWLTLRGLPVDTRYYLPMLAGAVVLIGLGACRYRPIRWTLGLGLAFSCLLSLSAAEGLLSRAPVRLSTEAFSSEVVARAGLWGLFAPPAPRRDPLLLALRGLMEQVVEAAPRGRARRVLLVSPPFAEGRSVGLEDRALVAVAMLRGLDEGVIQLWSYGTAPREPESASWLAIAGLKLPEAESTLSMLGDRVGAPTLVADAEGRAVRLYPLH